MAASSLPGVTDDRETPLADRLVDWQLASTTAQRLAAAGPPASASEISQLVSSLRAAAQAAGAPVVEQTQLTLPHSAAPAKILVVDRAGWIRANAEAMRATIAPALQTLAERRQGAVFTAPPPHPDGLAARMTRQAAAGQFGAVLAFLSARVLGQYDLAPRAQARLLLVAPNILQAERQLGVVAADFRLWVCLHEETHRVQFTAVPWLREYLLGELGRLVIGIGGQQSGAEGPARGVLQRLRHSGGADLFTQPGQRERLERLAAVMSLLEGHADVTMDAVGPELIPSIRFIRERFTARREKTDPIRRLLGRALGLAEKMRQYREGAKFVRAVTAEVGVPGFNRIWTSPNTLPTPAEIADPLVWVRRVHG